MEKIKKMKLKSLTNGGGVYGRINMVSYSVPYFGIRPRPRIGHKIMQKLCEWAG